MLVCLRALSQGMVQCHPLRGMVATQLQRRLPGAGGEEGRRGRVDFETAFDGSFGHPLRRPKGDPLNKGVERRKLEGSQGREEESSPKSAACAVCSSARQNQKCRSLD